MRVNLEYIDIKYMYDCLSTSRYSHYNPSIARKYPTNSFTRMVDTRYLEIATRVEKLC